MKCRPIRCKHVRGTGAQILYWPRLQESVSSNLHITVRHNGRDSVSNHQPHHCLLNRLFRRRSKKTSKLRVTGLCVGNSPETFWWRHHDSCNYFSWLGLNSSSIWYFMLSELILWYDIQHILSGWSTSVAIDTPGTCGYFWINLDEIKYFLILHNLVVSVATDAKAGAGASVGAVLTMICCKGSQMVFLRPPMGSCQIS